MYKLKTFNDIFGHQEQNKPQLHPFPWLMQQSTKAACHRDSSSSLHSLGVSMSHGVNHSFSRHRCSFYIINVVFLMLFRLSIPGIVILFDNKNLCHCSCSNYWNRLNVIFSSCQLIDKTEMSQDSKTSRDVTYSALLRDAIIEITGIAHFIPIIYVFTVALTRIASKTLHWCYENCMNTIKTASDAMACLKHPDSAGKKKNPCKMWLWLIVASAMEPNEVAACFVLSDRRYH